MASYCTPLDKNEHAGFKINAHYVQMKSKLAFMSK